MRGSGDGHLLCADGIERWGLYGAAGILFCVRSPARFFLVHRSALVYHGGTWGLPGGALDAGEVALEAAWREALEELDVEEMPHRVLGQYVDRPSPDWSYTTFVIAVDEPFLLPEASWEREEAWETQASGWFTYDEVTQLDLLPAFGELWRRGELDVLLPASIAREEQNAGPSGE